MALRRSRPEGMPSELTAPAVAWSRGISPDMSTAGAICASSELRLIIITNDKEVVLGCRQEAHEAQLGGVDVLELIDQDV